MLDVESGELIRSFSCGDFNRMFITPDTKHLILVGRYRTHLLNLETGVEKRVKGNYVLSTLDDGSIYHCARTKTNRTYTVSRVRVLGDNIIKTPVMSVPNPQNEKHTSFVGGEKYFFCNGYIWDLRTHKAIPIERVSTFCDFFTCGSKILPSYSPRLTNIAVAEKFGYVALPRRNRYHAPRFLTKRYYGTQDIYNREIEVRRIEDGEVVLALSHSRYVDNNEEYLVVNGIESIEIWDLKTFCRISTLNGVTSAISRSIIFKKKSHAELKRFFTKLSESTSFYDLDIQ
jgi:hypothetical protein